MLKEFISIVFTLVHYHKWEELKTFFDLIIKITTIHLVITPGQPENL